MIDILEVEELNTNYEKELWDLFVQGLMKSLEYRLNISVVVKVDDPDTEFLGKDVFISCTLCKSLLYEAHYRVPLHLVCNNSGTADRIAETFSKGLEKYILMTVFKGPEYKNKDLEEFIEINTGGWR